MKGNIMTNTRININELEFHRAGSDYLGFVWSAHVTGYNFTLREPIDIIREDGSTYAAWPVKKEKMNGVMCFMIVDEDGAMMFDF